MPYWRRVWRSYFVGIYPMGWIFRVCEVFRVNRLRFSEWVFFSGPSCLWLWLRWTSFKLTFPEFFDIYIRWRTCQLELSIKLLLQELFDFGGIFESLDHFLMIFLLDLMSYHFILQLDLLINPFQVWLPCDSEPDLRPSIDQAELIGLANVQIPHEFFTYGDLAVHPEKPP